MEKQPVKSRIKTAVIAGVPGCARLKPSSDPWIIGPYEGLSESLGELRNPRTWYYIAMYLTLHKCEDEECRRALAWDAATAKYHRPRWKSSEIRPDIAVKQLGLVG